MTQDHTDTLRSVFITGLKDAHALEHQALALMDRQIDRMQSYPEVEAQLRKHRLETEQQIKRLDEILESFGESHSALKDAVLGMAGNIAALGHAFAADEILKNAMANHAFENFEVASYVSLISLSEAASHSSHSMLLRETLKEEEAMAGWVKDNIPALTLKYVDLRAKNEQASH